MSVPISPQPVRGTGGNDLPAYLSNGLIGLRVRPNPLLTGSMMVSGYSGEDPVHRIDAAAPAPYPLALDIALDSVWASDAPGQVTVVEQRYDFGNGELTTSLKFAVEGRQLELTIIAFCSRNQPTIVCQEMSVRTARAADIKLRAFVDCRGIEGSAIRAQRQTTGPDGPSCDGALRWESAGGLATCGIAYQTDLSGVDSDPERSPLHNGVFTSEYAFRARAGRPYVLRQTASVVCSALNKQSDDQAVRLLGRALHDGFDSLRKANRAVWKELWKSRIQLIGADERWQALADATFFYVNSSVHSSSPASTSIFGLSTWHDYHYYYGHVMWDIEAFAVPPITLIQPDAANALLNYRTRSLPAAYRNAQLMGRLGLQFPWESAPSTSEEAAPMPGSASWHEDHVSLDVALAFAYYADVTGEPRFLHDSAWPVLAGVSDWLTSRAVKTSRGYEIQKAMGIAERVSPCDNAAFTNMAAKLVLRRTLAAAQTLDKPVNSKWAEIADGLVVPKRGDVVMSHDKFRINEEKGATPDPLMGIFPGGYELDPAIEQATLNFYLGKADQYIGAPMLSALFGVWAAWTGDRALAAKLLNDGYGRFSVGRFLQILEYRPDVFPEQPRASPFVANMGGFLTSLLLGFPGLRPSAMDPQDWPARPVVLPAGWDAIEVEQLWIRGCPTGLIARHGDNRAQLIPGNNREI